MGKKNSRRKRKLARERERLDLKAARERVLRDEQFARGAARERARQDRYDEFRRLVAEGRAPGWTANIEQQLARRLEQNEKMVRRLDESSERLRQALARIRAGEGVQVRFSPELERQVRDAVLDMEVEIVEDDG